MVCWWEGDQSERFWAEIRYQPGIGTSLSCPVLDENGNPNPWWDLVEQVNRGDIVYHWNAVQHRFVGRSEAAGVFQLIDGERRVRLTNFLPIQATIDLELIRYKATEVIGIRDNLLTRYPRMPLYLPFQFRSDGLRMISNYFAKLPREAVLLFFDETGLGEGNAEPPPAEDGPVDDGVHPMSDIAFLSPFKAKADSWYVANIQGGPQRKGRTHETLVNDFAAWLKDKGFDGIGRNAAIDLGLDEPPVIIEAKIIAKSWKHPLREAVGQLYEYRYFKIGNPDSALMILASQPVPSDWLRYLERDRSIGVAWRDGDSFGLSKLALAVLNLQT